LIPFEQISISFCERVGVSMRASRFVLSHIRLNSQQNKRVQAVLKF